MEDTLKPVEYTALMYEICSLQPNSRALSFRLPDRTKHVLYCMIRIDKLYPAEFEDQIRSTCTAWEVDLTTGVSQIVKLDIRMGERVEDVLAGVFANSVLALRARLKSILLNPEIKALLRELEKQGFNHKAKYIKDYKVFLEPYISPVILRYR